MSCCSSASLREFRALSIVVSFILGRFRSQVDRRVSYPEALQSTPVHVPHSGKLNKQQESVVVLLQYCVVTDENDVNSRC